MAKTKWLSQYDDLTPEERKKRALEILSRGYLRFIRKKIQNSRDDDEKNLISNPVSGYDLLDASS